MVLFKRIIKKLEKKLEINVGGFSKNFLYLFTHNVFIIIFSLSLSIILTRVLSQETFGQYNFILSIFGLVTILSLPGMKPSITMSCARGYEGSFWEGTKIRIKWGLLGSFVLFCFGLYYINTSISLVLSFLIASLFFISYNSFKTFDSYLLGKKSFKRYSAYLSLTIIIANFFTIVVAYYFRNLVLILFVLLGLVSLMNSLFLIKTLKERNNKKIDKGIVSYGKQLTLVNLIPSIKSHLDKIIVFSFLGFEALAIYSVAIIIPKQIKPLWAIINSIIFTDLSKKTKEDAYFAVRKRFKFLILFQILIVFIGIIVVPFLIHYFYSEKYLESIFYAQILMLLTFVGPSTLLANLAASQKQLRSVYKISIIPPIIQIILLLILIPLFGLLGASLATAIGGGLIPLFLSYFVIFYSKKSKK